MSRRNRSPVALTILAIALAVAAFLLDAWANGQLYGCHH